VVAVPRRMFMETRFLPVKYLADDTFLRRFWLHEDELNIFIQPDTAEKGIKAQKFTAKNLKSVKMFDLSSCNQSLDCQGQESN
jgi:hypothetical protein